MYWLAKHVEEELAHVFEDALPEGASASYIKVNHQIHLRIHSALGAAARLRNLLRQRDTGRSQRRQEVLNRRTACLQKIMEGIDLSAVMDGAARNSIEHFDEYFDHVALKAYSGVLPTPALYAADMVLSHRNLLQRYRVEDKTPFVFFVRAYIADEKTFSNCGREVPLEPLHDCCAAIRARLRAQVPEIEGEQGGFMLVITSEVFAR